MDGNEYLRQCKAAKEKYKSELRKLSHDFIASNISFKKGDIVEVKNVFLSGKYVVDDIYTIHDDDFDAVQSPSCLIHTIQVTGRKISPDGTPSKYSNHFRPTDVIKE